METVFKQEASMVDLRMLDSGILSEGKYYGKLQPSLCEWLQRC